jgi:hypothetical protein
LAASPVIELVNAPVVDGKPEILSSYVFIEEALASLK